jgi:hypothetical protein
MTTSVSAYLVLTAGNFLGSVVKVSGSASMLVLTARTCHEPVTCDCCPGGDRFWIRYREFGAVDHLPQHRIGCWCVAQVVL